LNAKLSWCRFGALFEQSSAELPAQSLYNLFINSEINQVIPKHSTSFVTTPWKILKVNGVGQQWNKRVEIRAWRRCRVAGKLPRHHTGLNFEPDTLLM
jgi:hypothetical protein